MASRAWGMLSVVRRNDGSCDVVILPADDRFNRFPMHYAWTISPQVLAVFLVSPQVRSRFIELANVFGPTFYGAYAHPSAADIDSDRGIDSCQHRSRHHHPES
jgi:hypothetical protein